MLQGVVHSSMCLLSSRGAAVDQVSPPDLSIHHQYTLCHSVPACPCCRSLQCPHCTVQAEGVLAPDVAWMSTLATFNIQQNTLTGPLLPEYGDTGALPNLLHLVISSNLLLGGWPRRTARPPCADRGAVAAVADGCRGGL